jgi:aryl-alcohol dehydrogenase-like predicted oxidoreductase
MQRRQLPGTEFDVSELCFGMGGFGTTTRGDKTDRLVTAYFEAGGNFFDTAHCYLFWEQNGDGASERELGASLRRLGLRDQVIVATKGGHPDAGAAYRRPDGYLSEKLITSDIDESLERLGDERIDLYYLHRDDPRLPVAEIMGMLNREIERGRLRSLGASNWSVPRIAAANDYASRHGLHGFVVSSVMASLADPDWKIGPEPTMRYVTRDEEIWHTATQMPLVAYSATGTGFFARTSDAAKPDANPANKARRERAQSLASKLGCSPTQIAIAWLLHQPYPIVPLTGTTNPAHLVEILGATSVPLTPEQVQWLRHG